MKKSRKQISRAKLKILTILWTCRIAFYLAFLGIVGFYSWLINKVLQATILLVGYTLFRWCYPTTWHAKTTQQCFAYSVLIFCFCTTLCLPIGVSIVSSVFVAVGLTYVLYKVQWLIDKALHRIDIKEYLYSLTEDELRNYAKSKDISEMIVDTIVLRVIHNYRWVDIRKERNYSKTGLDYHKEVIFKKLNVKL